ncbi:MAG TPA: hypothetical protein PKH10_00015 [bacterium]|nr:hypothetical protein [bacterium]
MQGPFYLFRSIVTLVTERRGAGHFRICDKDDRRGLVVRKVGWSDDLQTELLKQAGDRSFNSFFRSFFFEYADSPGEAYERALLDYHEFRGTLGEQEPPRPPTDDPSHRDGRDKNHLSGAGV